MAARCLPTRVVALIAAYVLALQGMLAVASPTVPTALAVDFSILCSGKGASEPSHTPDHAPRCQAICAAMGQGSVGAPPPEVAVALVVRAPESTLVPDRSRAAVRHSFRSLRLPRGPPLA
jgi:hypothetical protein